LEVRAGHLKCNRRRLRDQEQNLRGLASLCVFYFAPPLFMHFLFTQPERTFRSTAGYYVNTFQRDEATKLFVLETVTTPMVPRTI
jgi:hypothetical protein